MNLRSNKGFSLVELIIVIAILGIIALIAVPNLTGIQQRSQVNADIRTAEQIGKAIRIYVTDGKAANVTTDWKDYSTLTGIESYIPSTYVPKSVTDAAGGHYWVKKFVPTGAAEGEVRIAVAIGTAGPTTNVEYTAGGTPGIAYVEGASSLTDGIGLIP